MSFHYILSTQSFRLSLVTLTFLNFTTTPRVGLDPRVCIWNSFMNDYSVRATKSITGLVDNIIESFRHCFTVNDGRTAAPQYRGLGSAFSTIFRQEGLRGLYKGVTPNAWGSGSAWGFYFLLWVLRHSSLIGFITKPPSIASQLQHNQGMDSGRKHDHRTRTRAPHARCQRGRSSHAPDDKSNLGREDALVPAVRQ